MARIWGAAVYRDSGYYQQVGLDLSVSGTTVSWAGLLYSSGSMYATNPYAVSGAVARSGSVYSSSSTAFTQTITSGSFVGSRGSTYSFGFSMTIFWGGRPSVSSSVKVPATVPSKPAKPTMTATGKTTASSNLASAPGNGGAAISRYEWNLKGTTTWVSSGTSRSHSWTGLTPGTQYRTRVRAVNSAGAGTASDWSDYVSLDPNAPVAPSDLVLSRVSDSSTALVWTNNSSESAVYASQTVERAEIIPGTSQNGPWETVATLGGSASSYTATGQVVNNFYFYRITAENISGEAFSSFKTIATTPGAPIGVTAVKDGNNIIVSATGVFPQAVDYEWQDNPAGSGWVDIPGTTISPTLEVLSPNPSQTHQYRVRAKTSSLGTPSVTLYSDWSNPSAVIQLQAPPLAPTLKAPSASARLVAGSTALFQWAHNPVDGAAQTEFEFYIELDGGLPSASEFATTSVQELSYALWTSYGSGTWKVRTRAADPNFGAWSLPRTFVLGTVPTAVLSEPLDPLDIATATAKWVYNNVEGTPQASFTAKLRRAGGAVIETKTGTTDTQVSFATVLDNLTDYEIELQVTSSNGFVSEPVFRSFRTDYPLPNAVTPTVLWERFRGRNLLSFNVSPANTAVNGSFEEPREVLGVPVELSGDDVLITIG